MSLTLLDFSGFSLRSAAATGSLSHLAMTATSQRTITRMSVREPKQKNGKSKPFLIHTANSGTLDVDAFWPPSNDANYRLYNTAYSSDMVLMLDDDSVGTPISLVSRRGRRDEIWEIDEI